MTGSPLLDKLRRAAENAGMIDPEDVRMVDISRIRLNADGDVMIPPGFFENLRRAKPQLFGPGPDVRGLSPADLRKAEAGMLRRTRDDEFRRSRDRATAKAMADHEARFPKDGA